MTPQATTRAPVAASTTLAPEPSPVSDDADAVDEVCFHKITLEIDGETMRIPYCRNLALGNPDVGLRRAVIVIHGKNRTAPAYFDSVLEAARKVDETTEFRTIILAPHFLVEEDVTHHELQDDVLFWASDGWQRGDESISTDAHPRPVSISSFSVVDTILERMSESDRFPNLEQIVIVGHSAGGQFVNRFAAGSQVEQTAIQQRGIEVRYVVANPSSYLYFNGERRVGDEGDQFATPETSSCPSYNAYKYGLENMNSYMAAVGAAQIRAQYPQRTLVYLLGSEDNDPASPLLDTNCAAMLQGSNRLERGMVYYSYLQHYFGEQALATHEMAYVLDVGHSSSEMFQSGAGVKALFE